MIVENIETWKDIPNYVGHYKVSSLGNIESIERQIWSVKNKCFNTLKSRLLKPLLTKHGYLRVCLQKKDKCNYIFIHRLVAISFIENNLNKTQVNHINGIKTDNRVENLEWNTPSENRKHAFKIGLSSARKGESSNMCKLTEIKVKEIRNSNLSQEKIAFIYNIKQSTVSNIKTKKTWKNI